MKKFFAILLTTIMLFSLGGCKADPTSKTGKKTKGVTLNMYAVTDAIIPALDAFYEDTGSELPTT